MRNKKIPAIIMMMVLMISLFSACGDDEKKTAAETPEKTVEAFVEELLDADFEGALQYVTKDCRLYTALEKLTDIDGALEEENMTEKERKIAKEMFDEIVKAIPEIGKSVKYQIGSAQIDSDTATVGIKLPAILGEDYEASPEFMGELFGILAQSPELMDVVEKREVNDEKSVKEIKKVLPKFKEALKKELERVGKTEMKVTLEKNGEKWLITGIRE